MGYLWTKQAAILENIANAETPNYKAKVVTFEESIRAQLEEAAKRPKGAGKAVRDILEDAEFTVFKAQEQDPYGRQRHQHHQRDDRADSQRLSAAVSVPGHQQALLLITYGGQKPVANSGTIPTASGVRVTEIVEDEDNPMKMVYDPTHPDANEDGYVELPNVDMVMEIADAMAASRAYASNVTAFNTLKSVISSGLEIGR